MACLGGSSCSGFSLGLAGALLRHRKGRGTGGAAVSEGAGRDCAATTPRSRPPGGDQSASLTAASCRSSIPDQRPPAPPAPPRGPAPPAAACCWQCAPAAPAPMRWTSWAPCTCMRVIDRGRLATQSAARGHFAAAAWATPGRCSSLVRSAEKQMCTSCDNQRCRLSWAPAAARCAAAAAAGAGMCGPGVQCSLDSVLPKQLVALLMLARRSVQLGGSKRGPMRRQFEHTSSPSHAGLYRWPTPLMQRGKRYCTTTCSRYGTGAQTGSTRERQWQWTNGGPAAQLLPLGEGLGLSRSP